MAFGLPSSLLFSKTRAKVISLKCISNTLMYSLKSRVVLWVVVQLFNVVWIWWSTAKDHFPHTHSIISWGVPRKRRQSNTVKSPGSLQRQSPLSPAHSHSSFDLRWEVISSRKMPLVPSTCYCHNLNLSVFIQHFAHSLPSSPNALTSFISPLAPCGWSLSGFPSRPCG